MKPVLAFQTRHVVQKNFQNDRNCGGEIACFEGCGMEGAVSGLAFGAKQKGVVDYLLVSFTLTSTA
jgi:hypothetical protein